MLKSHPVLLALAGAAFLLAVAACGQDEPAAMPSDMAMTQVYSGTVSTSGTLDAEAGIQVEARIGDDYVSAPARVESDGSYTLVVEPPPGIAAELINEMIEFQVVGMPEVKASQTRPYIGAGEESLDLVFSATAGGGSLIGGAQVATSGEGETRYRIALTLPCDSPSCYLSIGTILSDGSEEMRLVSRREAPAWSPDGTRIAYSDHDNDYIYTMAPDGSDVKQLTDDTIFNARWPSWSPDGTRIAFESRKNIYTMAADGSDVRRVTDTEYPDDKWPEWSPDGSRILFSRGSIAYGYKLYTIAPDGTDEVQVTDYKVAYPSWSPDGSRIIYSKAPEEGDPNDPYDDDLADQYRGMHTIYTIAADGTDVRELREGSHPVWFPDGERFLYFLGGSLYSAAADGSDARGIRANIDVPPSDFRLSISPIPAGTVPSPSDSAPTVTVELNDYERGGRLECLPSCTVEEGTPISVSIQPPRGGIFFRWECETEGIFSQLQGADPCDQIDIGSGEFSGMAFHGTGTDFSIMLTASYIEAADRCRPGSGRSEPPAEFNLMPGYEAELGEDGGAFSPSWSPDARCVVFQNNNTRKLFTAAADGSNVESLTGSLEAADPKWSPAEDIIAFTAHFEDVGLAIYTVASDGTGLKRVAAGPGDRGGRVGSLAWSPDGTRIAYTAGPELSVEEAAIYSVAADGSDARRLTEGGGSYISIAWSPDGTRIGFLSLGDEEDQTSEEVYSATIYSIATDGSNMRVEEEVSLDPLLLLIALWGNQNILNWTSEGPSVMEFDIPEFGEGG